MRKRIILVLLLIVTVGIGIFIYRELQQKPTISNTLSSRSQEFVKKQRQATDSELKYADIDGPSDVDTRNTRIGREGCYSFVIPFRITTTKFEEQQYNSCYARFSFDTPKGAIVAYTYVKKVDSWDDVDGVSYRRRKTDEYTEEIKTLNGKQFLMFKKIGDLYEKNVFYKTPEYYLVFNFITQTNQNLDTELDQMLSTLEIE